MSAQYTNAEIDSVVRGLNSVYRISDEPKSNPAKAARIIEQLRDEVKRLQIRCEEPRVMDLVEHVNLNDLQHRKGWRCSQKPNALDVQPDLEKETLELHRALADKAGFEAVLLQFGKLEDPDQKAYVEAVGAACKELADVYVCTLQIAYRLGLRMKDLEYYAEKKIRERFIGFPEKTDA